MLDVSTKDCRFIEAASNHATSSPMVSRHGCVITSGGKIVATGYNTDYRTHSRDKIIHSHTSCHAEIAALRNMNKVVHR